jgi:transcriptional regulator with GAF, ATPase, and Fis domain
LLREGRALGVILLRRMEVRPFSDKQIALLKTFADQAVIAIENVRLFNETKEALERQTATAEILEVIASSPSNVQPVFDAIARASVRLIGGFSAAVFRYDGDLVHLGALTSTSPSADEHLRRMFPRRPSDGVMNEMIASGSVSICTDTEADSAISEETREMARARGWRSRVMVPMFREGVSTGFISVTRVNHGPFSDHQIGLLKNFCGPSRHRDRERALVQRARGAHRCPLKVGRSADRARRSRPGDQLDARSRDRSSRRSSIVQCSSQGSTADRSTSTTSLRRNSICARPRTLTPNIWRC